MTTETKAKTISYSALTTYMSCPLRYKFVYVDKMEPDYTTDALVLGHTIHQALENCLNKYKETGVLTNGMELQNQYKRILDRELQLKRVKYKEGWSADKLSRMGSNMLAFWRESFFRDILSIREVVAVEERFCLEAHDPDTGLPLNRKITGVMDLILRLKRWPDNAYGPLIRKGQNYPGINSWLILDHKTSVQKYPTIKIDRDMQLTIYLWAAVQLGIIPDRSVTGVGFSVLHKKIRPEFSLHFSRRTELQESQMLRTFARVIDAIDLELFYPHFDHISCTNCPYYDNLCERW